MQSQLQTIYLCIFNFKIFFQVTSCMFSLNYWISNLIAWFLNLLFLYLFGSVLTLLWLGGMSLFPLPKFWKIQRRNQKTRYVSFWPLTQFCRISKMVGCIPEVLTLLLTPILKYICMPNARCYICHLCHNMPYMTGMVLWHTPYVCMTI